MLYFDHNATTPLNPAARHAWLEAAEQFVGNPSSPHRLGSRAEKALNDSRQKLAGILKCEPTDIIWTSGATESSNTVLHHFARVLPQKEILISGVEHPCVLAAARYYFPKRHHLIPTTRDGVVDLSWLHDRLDKNNVGLVAVMAANNETGVLQPWTELITLCQRFGMPFFCDAVQWIGKMPAKDLGRCAFVSGSAHKFGGPKGVGFLKISGSSAFEPLLRGGEQEEGRRAGTENVPGVLSMVAALEEREERLSETSLHDRLRWRTEFERNLLNVVPGTEIVGGNTDRLWNTVSALMPSLDCRQRWVVRLDRYGYAVSTGSACASGREEPSHVLRTMGYTPEEAGRALRFSAGWETTAEDWEGLLEGLRKTRDSFVSV